MEFPRLRDFPRFAFDTETTGLNWPVDTLFAFSISTPDGKDYYYDTRKTPSAISKFNSEIRGYRGRIICHSASFDYRMGHSANVRIPINLLDDTVIRACLIDEHLLDYSLDGLCLRYLGKGKDTTIYDTLAEMFGGNPTRKAQINRIPKAPYESAAHYAKLDTRRTLELWEWQEQEIIRQDNNKNSYGAPSLRKIMDFERSLMPQFIETEMHGIRVDLDETERAMASLSPIIVSLQDEVDELFGKSLNVDSPKQLKEFFEPIEKEDGWYTKFGDKIGITPKGGPSLRADYLREMKHPVAGKIIELRSLMKTRGTFLGKHILEHAINGRVYPTINQNKGEDGGTGTGRLSYQDPALQQIPSRNKRVAEIVKSCFLPDEGQIWVDADQHSFEVRIFAHLVNNPEIIAAYLNDPELDFHQFVADLTGLVRSATYSGQPNAKQLNLSMIFNSGDGAIADKMGMPWKWESFNEKRTGKTITYKKAGAEAKRVINRYHKRIPGIKELAEGCKYASEKYGFIFTFKGRRLRFPNKFKSYKASGLLIQSTAAEYNKENWGIIKEALGNSGRLLLNTHDSYSMSIDEDWKPHFKRVKEAVETSGRARVPLILELSGAGSNWWRAICK